MRKSSVLNDRKKHALKGGSKIVSTVPQGTTRVKFPVKRRSKKWCGGSVSTRKVTFLIEYKKPSCVKGERDTTAWGKRSPELWRRGKENKIPFQRHSNEGAGGEFSSTGTATEGKKQYEVNDGERSRYMGALKTFWGWKKKTNQSMTKSLGVDWDSSKCVVSQREPRTFHGLWAISRNAPRGGPVESQTGGCAAKTALSVRWE